MKSKNILYVIVAILLFKFQVAGASCLPTDPPESCSDTVNSSDSSSDNSSVIAVAGIATIGAAVWYFSHKSNSNSNDLRDPLRAEGETDKFKVNFYANQDDYSDDFGVNFRYTF